jgi:cytochrome P450
MPKPIKYQLCLFCQHIFTTFNLIHRMAAFPFIARSCTKDYQIPGTSFVVPKGTPVFIPILGFHMDPKLFPNPEKFDPERFSAENKGNILTGSFIPFGLGPRMCLGKNFIRMEGRCFLANMVRSFRILPSDKTIKNLEWEVESQGKVKGGLFVKLERREN